MERATSPILLKDKYDKIIDNNIIIKQNVDNFRLLDNCTCSKFFFSTGIQGDGKMAHINKLYEDKDDIIFSFDDIRSQPNNFPNKNSYGFDGIPNILLTKLSEETCV